jgi:hypothetical protein
MLCVVANNEPQTANNIREHFRIIAGIVKESVCCLIELRTCTHHDEKVRGVISKKLPNTCRSFAILTSTPCEDFLANMIFKRYAAYGAPVGVFDREREARVWLRKNPTANKKTGPAVRKSAKLL